MVRKKYSSPKSKFSHFVRTFFTDKVFPSVTKNKLSDKFSYGII